MDAWLGTPTKPTTWLDSNLIDLNSGPFSLALDLARMFIASWRGFLFPHLFASMVSLFPPKCTLILSFSISSVPVHASSLLSD